MTIEENFPPLVTEGVSTLLPRGLESISDEQRKQAIALFMDEMQKPYRIELDPTKTDFRKYDDCVGKSVRLHEALAAIGVETEFGVCEYSNGAMNLPFDVLKEPHVDEGMHLFLMYKYVDPGTGELEWRILDPTWHPGLRIGFEVNVWDGVHGTTLAVAPTTMPRQVDFATAEELFSPDLFAEDLEVNGAFYKALNEYFAYLEKRDAETADFRHPSLDATYPYPEPVKPSTEPWDYQI